MHDDAGPADSNHAETDHAVVDRFVVGVADTRSRLSNAASATTRSRRPKMGMERSEEPQTTGSHNGIVVEAGKALATSVTARAYSSGDLWPICHGPSMSLPRPHC